MKWRRRPEPHGQDSFNPPPPLVTTGPMRDLDGTELPPYVEAPPVRPSLMVQDAIREATRDVEFPSLVNDVVRRAMRAHVEAAETELREQGCTARMVLRSELIDSLALLLEAIDNQIRLGGNISLPDSIAVPRAKIRAILGLHHQAWLAAGVYQQALRQSFDL